MIMNEQKLVGYEGLRFAIVMSAVRDYRRASRYTDKHQGEKNSCMSQMLWLKSQCESFFRSDWYKLICDIDGEKLMEIAPKLEKGFFDKGGEMRDVIY